MSAPDKPGASPAADNDARLLAAIDYRTKALELSLAAWPVFEQSTGTNTSGLACAVVIMRHLLCHFPSHAREEYLAKLGAEAVAKNTLLTAALSTDRAVASELCQRLQDSLDPDKLSFERLMDSEAMQTTAWKTRYFCFFGDSYQRDSKQEPWRPLPDSDMPVTEKDFLIWDGVQETTIGKYLSIFSTTLIHQVTGYQMVKFTNAPLVLRIVFTNESPTLAFYRDLFQFTLRLATRGVAPPRAYSYSCAAAVRVRTTPDGNDTLRLYNSDGSPFRPEGGLLPWSDAWRVEDEDKYVLFFIRSDAFPEDPAPLAESNHDTEGLELVRLAPMDEIRKVPEQQAAGVSPPVPVFPRAPRQSPSPRPTPSWGNMMVDDFGSGGFFGASTTSLSIWGASITNAADETREVLDDPGDTDSDTQAARVNLQSNEPVVQPPLFVSSSNAPARRTHRGSRHPRKSVATDANQEAIVNPRLPLPNSGDRRGVPVPEDGPQGRIAPRQTSPPFGERLPINPPRRDNPEFIRRSLSAERNPRQYDQSRGRPPPQHRSGWSGSRDYPSSYQPRSRSPRPDERGRRKSRTYGRNSRDYDNDERDYNQRR
jgi:hypothetical protein